MVRVRSRGTGNQLELRAIEPILGPRGNGEEKGVMLACWV